MMRSVWIGRVLSAVFLATVVLAAPSARAESLSDALIAAYKNSNLLSQQRALLRAADEDVVQAAAALKPVVNFIAQSSFSSPAGGQTPSSNWSHALSLDADLTLYDNGVSRYSKDAAKETVLGLRSGLQQIEQRVLLDTVVAYMEMIRAAQSVSLGQNNVRLITQELRAARDRFEVGEVTRTDVSIAEARLAASRGNLAAAQGDLEIAREDYKAKVGNYPGNLRWPTTPKIKARTENEAKAFAVRYHPSVDEAQRNVNAAEANVLRAKAAIGPTVTAGATYTVREGLSESDGFSANVRATVPIYRGGTLKSLTRQAVARRDASRAGLLQTVVDVKFSVGQSWASLAVAAARTEASRRQVRASQVAYNGIREEAKFGSRTTLDVLNSEQELLDARSNLITAEVQQYVSLYSLLASMGLLTAEHLNLGIVTYDPADYYNYATTQDPMHKISKQGAALDRLLKRIAN